jgi:hypothetical protein
MNCLLRRCSAQPRRCWARAGLRLIVLGLPRQHASTLGQPGRQDARRESPPFPFAAWCGFSLLAPARHRGDDRLLSAGATAPSPLTGDLPITPTSARSCWPSARLWGGSSARLFLRLVLAPWRSPQKLPARGRQTAYRRSSVYRSAPPLPLLPLPCHATSSRPHPHLQPITPTLHSTSLHLELGKPVA